MCGVLAFGSFWRSRLIAFHVVLSNSIGNSLFKLTVPFGDRKLDGLLLLHAASMLHQDAGFRQDAAS